MFFLFKSFEGFFQKNPSYFQGVPLSDQKLMFSISFDATRDVAKSEVKHLSES